MADETILIDVRGDVSHYVGETRKAAQATDGLKSSVDRTATSTRDLSRLSEAAGGRIGELGGRVKALGAALGPAGIAAGAAAARGCAQDAPREPVVPTKRDAR